ncbi:adenylate/guanylate cyclase domain-containing protein [Dongia sp. agr-C8]
MKRYRAPIWLVFALVFGGLVTLTAGAIGFRLFYSAFSATNTYARDRGDAALTGIEEAVRQEMRPAEEQGEFLSGYILSGKVRIDDDQRISDLLLGSLASAPQIFAVAFIRADLHVVSAARDVNGEAFATAVENEVSNPMFRLALRSGASMDKPGWAPPIYAKGIHSSGVPFVAPLRKDGRIIGVITALISPRAMAKHILIQTGNSGLPGFVLMGDGRVLVHPEVADGSYVATEEKPLPEIADLQDPLLRGFQPDSCDDEAARFISARANFRVCEGVGPAEEYLFVYRNLISDMHPWTVLVAVPQSALTDVYSNLFKALTVSLIMLAVAILAGVGLGWLFARPIHGYARAARQLSALDFDNAPQLKGSWLREFDVAAEAYNGMRSGLTWLSTYVPRTLVPALMEPDSAESFTAKEREVTVLFTDIIGFTAIGHRLGPAALARFLNRHFEILGEAIEAEGGTIDKYIGDSVMAFWGAPTAQGDHAERAARAAVEMGRRLRADNARRKRKGLNPIRVRIGLHTGTALAGNIGATGRINYTLVGETVNVAQRLEQFAKEIDDGHSEVIIVASADVAGRLPVEIPQQPLGRHAVVERAPPMEVYRLGGEDTETRSVTPPRD